MTGGGFIAGSIIAKLLLDKTGWNASTTAVSKEAKKLEDDLNKLSGIVSGVAKAFALIGVAATAALAVALKKTADLGEQFYDLSQKTGISTEMLSGYKLTVDKSGTSIEQFAIGMRGLSRVMGDASGGGKEAREVFSRLGVQYADNAGKVRPLNDVMLDLADRFSKMPDGAEKAALAMQAFGRSGMELIPMLNLGREGLEANYEATKRLGGLWSAEAARAADAFNDSLAELKLSFGSVLKDGLVAIMPAVQHFVEGVTSGLAKIRDKITAFVESGQLEEWAQRILGIMSSLAKGLGYLAIAFEKLSDDSKKTRVVFDPFNLGVKEALDSIDSFQKSLKVLTPAWETLEAEAMKGAKSFDIYKERVKATDDALVASKSTVIKWVNAAADFLGIHEKLPPAINKTGSSFDAAEKQAKKFHDRMRDLSKEVAALALIELPDLNLEIKETANITDKWFKDMVQGGEDIVGPFKAIPMWVDRAEKPVKALAKTWEQTALAISATMGQALGVIDQLSQASFDRRFAELDTWYEKQKAVIEGSQLGEVNKANALLALDKEYNEKRKDIQREQAKQQKALAITQAVINTAEAVTKALTGAIPPFNYILAAISAAMGAVQIALIRAQPIPLAKGAIFKQPAFLESARTGQRYEVGEGGEAEILSSVSKLREAIFGRGGAGGGRAVSLTVPIYIGAKKVEEHVIRIVEDASAIGRLRIQAKSIA